MKARAVALLLVFETMALFLASHLSLALLGAPMAGLTALVEPRSGFETIADELFVLRDSAASGHIGRDLVDRTAPVGKLPHGRGRRV